MTGFVFGLVPALHAADADLHRSLKDGGRGAGGSAQRNRMRNALVVIEIALSLILLVGASLFVRSFLNLQGAGVGVDTAPLMTLRFFMAGEQYRHRRVTGSPRRRHPADGLKRSPGVEAAFASNLVPLGGGGAGGGR